MREFDPCEAVESVVAERNIVVFLSDVALNPNPNGGAWDEAGRAIEAGYRAPLPIGPRLVMAIAVTLPLLLLPLLAHAFLILARAWAN
jgi:hypothetical protein